MILQHKTEICVADGRKLLLLVNEGDTKFPDLQVIREETQELLPDRELSTDRPGRSFQSVGARRSSYEETDFKQLAEDRFAAEVADILKKRALGGKTERLIIIAPPATLGEMRKHYHKALSAVLKGEIAKDLTGHAIADVEGAITAA